MKIAAANDLDVMVGDIGNAYLHASTEEKVYTCAGAEFAAVDTWRYALPMSPTMTSKLLAAAIFIKILAETDFIVDAYTSCQVESTTFPPITSLVFLLRSTLTSNIILRGANWKPFPLALRKEDGNYSNKFMLIKASSSLRIVSRQSILPFSLSNCKASFTFLGTLIPYLIPDVLSERRSLPLGLLSLARRII